MILQFILVKLQIVHFAENGVKNAEPLLPVLEKKKKLGIKVRPLI